MARFTAETMKAAVDEYLAGSDPIEKVAERYNVTRSALMRWLSRYPDLEEEEKKRTGRVPKAVMLRYDPEYDNLVISYSNSKLSLPRKDFMMKFDMLLRAGLPLGYVDYSGNDTKLHIPRDDNA